MIEYWYEGPAGGGYENVLIGDGSRALRHPVTNDIGTYGPNGFQPMGKGVKKGGAAEHRIFQNVPYGNPQSRVPTIQNAQEPTFNQAPIPTDQPARQTVLATPGQRPPRKAPNPWQINPGVWDSMGRVGQEMALGLAESEGWDAGDYVRQHMNSRPVGTAPRMTRMNYAQPRGMYR